MESCVTWNVQNCTIVSQFHSKKQSYSQLLRCSCFDTITSVWLITNNRKQRKSNRGFVYRRVFSMCLSSRKLQRSCLNSKMKVISASNGKRANLSAARKEKIKLPNYDDDAYHISKFLSHPSGIEAILNKEALQSFKLIDSNVYRCTLPKVKLLNFEAYPLLDLQVVPTSEYCTVEMISCKFEGSNLVERQNENFSAFMKNQMTWETSDSDTYLEIDATLNLTLEIYTRPFTFLPTSAVETPGNIMIQTLLDRLVPLLLQQLIQDYSKWVNLQRGYLS